MNGKSSKIIIFLKWFLSPFRWTIILTILLLISGYGGNIFIVAAVFLLISISISISIIRLIISVIRKRGKRLIIKLIAQLVFAIAFPLLTIILIYPNRWTIDFACTSAVVKIIEPILIQEIQKSPGKLFKFRSFYFGQVMGNVRWIVYDESEQVLLVPGKRSQEWWLITGEDKGYDNDCLTAAQRIYSHFFIRYSSCM
ncbi:MAG: hypothetical protein PHE96_09520 [Methylococcales bacterium]|nr:hypothetical protein [Methylococcales bacterium]